MLWVSFAGHYHLCCHQSSSLVIKGNRALQTLSLKTPAPLSGWQSTRGLKKIIILQVMTITVKFCCPDINMHLQRQASHYLAS
jgi:small-conductance mechanosensitive channel